MNKTIQSSFSADNLQDWLTHLEKLHPNAIELGLTRITKVGESLNLIHFDAKVITVAGTNGKGTTCAYLERILLDSGFKVGVYSSPHIHRYNERLRINGHELNDQVHCEAFAVIEEGRLDTSLSYFEFATLACLQILKQEQCDYILLEVGLGGRLDATNMVESDVSVVTTIGIDHIDWLGSDREVIGFEKAGVFRTSKPAICGELDIPQSIVEHAKTISANLKRANHEFNVELINESEWMWHGKKTLGPIKQTLMPIQNASTALAVIESLDLDICSEQLIDSIQSASLVGRLQKLNNTACDLYIDVAHNPQSAEYLASQLKRLKAQKSDNCKIHAIVGMLSDKDMSATFTAMNLQIDNYNFVDLHCFRGATAKMLIKAYENSESSQHNVTCFENVLSAVNKVVNYVDASDIIIIFGSFYTVSEILNYEQG